MGAKYKQALDVFETVHVVVDFVTRRDEVIDYAVVLVADLDGCVETIRVYDGRHGRNEMHRYTNETGKQLAEVFHPGTLGEGMRMAIGDIQRGFEEMIDGWRRG